MKVYESILEKVGKYEQKNGIYYTKTRGKLFKWLTAFSGVAFIYTMVMNIAYLASVALIYLAKDTTKNATYSFSSVLVCSVALILGAVFLLGKFKISGILIQLVSLPLLLVTFGYYLKEPVVFSFKAAFYYRHFVPIVILFVLLCIMLVIALKERIKSKQSYMRVYQGIYEQYQSQNPDSLNDEDWEDFLENYNGQI